MGVSIPSRPTFVSSTDHVEFSGHEVVVSILRQWTMLIEASLSKVPTSASDEVAPVLQSLVWNLEVGQDAEEFPLGPETYPRGRK